MTKLYLKVDMEGQNPHNLRKFIEHAESEIIRQRGERDGHDAGTWVFDGNTQEEHFKRIQKGIEDGDPEFMDMIPSPRVGGEFADDPTWDQILNEELNLGGLDTAGFHPATDSLYETYCEAFQTGAQDEILSYGRESVKA